MTNSGDMDPDELRDFLRRLSESAESGKELQPNHCEKNPVPASSNRSTRRSREPARRAFSIDFYHKFKLLL
ncbi:unnamed protein product, partial [Mesorhabditis belari]|uniref:Uncharacterized protein n=1 Tax=Mesorhabditis belari TaxID=2138241 RepID=A0AAF3ELB4_9BILA